VYSQFPGVCISQVSVVEMFELAMNRYSNRVPEPILAGSVEAQLNLIWLLKGLTISMPGVSSLFIDWYPSKVSFAGS